MFSFQSLTPDQVKTYLDTPVIYTIRKSQTGHPLATIDSNGKYKIDKDKFSQIFSHYPEEQAEKHYEYLNTFLNAEQVALCPFCESPDHVSAILQGEEHSKYECHKGHREYYFSQYTNFTPRVFKMLPEWLQRWEKQRVLGNYKMQGIGSRVVRNDSGLYLRCHLVDLERFVMLEYMPFPKWKFQYFPTM